MPSNELTWALYGMAIVAAPTAAVWLWRRLGRGGRHKLGPEIAPGWYMDFDDSTVGDMRIEPAPKETYCEVRCNLCGTRMAAVGTNRDEGSTIYECDNPACVNQVIIEPAKKPAPYAASAKALGSKPEAPWVTREEFEQELNTADNAIQMLHDRLSAIEAKHPAQPEAKPARDVRVFRGFNRRHYVVPMAGGDWFKDCPSSWIKSNTPWSADQHVRKGSVELDPDSPDAQRIVAEWREAVSS